MPLVRLKYQAAMYTLEDAIEDMRDVVCPNCREYKGITTGPDGERYCVFCD
jgi:hypothetical protein